ncbi:sigma-70 family RNA polymerase sigma factor [Bacillus canaveralius]|uniref:sigma-70 family RNA polymerase sigma factor n=1 Tax=Bacillus canaveralius TaxID=1403243 RepID=UPI000F77944D|nr:sigma-70 family RNA polymerase sigma factor [Bacillus canaveralius]RSK54158.1 sigma-70 family RNA polymerase sigma factor [Bacillus canaveralius]
MQDSELGILISAAVNGNEIDRETIIRHYRPYIINMAGHITGRYINWSEEEASVSLLAFNRAIDTYNSQRGRSFLNYAYLLIKRDLIDFFRKEQKADRLNQDEECEEKQSLKSYQQTLQEKELIEEILEFKKSLNEFDILFEELEHYAPKHKDSRDKMILMAHQFVGFPELVEDFLKKKRLPATLFSKKTGYSIKTVERHRKYLITLIILRLHPEWRQLTQYISIPAGDEQLC